MSDPADLFDVPADVAWINTAYMGVLPKKAVEVARATADAKERPWEFVPARFFDDSEAVRAQAARLFGATADDMAIVPAVSYGLAVAAKNLPVGPGGEIIVLDGQFPSNVYTWRELQKDGAVLTTVSRSHNQSWTDAVVDAIGADTRVVAVPQTHWIDGGALDLVKVGEAARAAGAALVLDLTQSLGAVPFDAKAVDPDFAVAAGYKWLLGPYSLGWLYVAPRWHDGRPLEHNWIARAGSGNFASLIDYQDDYQTGARRFDVGERSNFALMPVASAALETVLDITPQRIGDIAGARSREIADGLGALGFTAEPDELRSPHYLSMRAPDGAPEDLTARLADEKIFVSQRGPRMRITPHVHVTDNDVARLLAAVKAALA